jgi:subfamily B ATP-binding cassette protein MsbA
MRNLTRILRLVIHYKKYAALNVLFNILYVIFNLLSMVMLIPFLKLIFNEQFTVVPRPEWNSVAGLGGYLEQYYNYQMSEFILSNGKTGALGFVCVTMAFTFLLKLITRYLAMYYLAVIRNGVVADLRQQLYTKMVILPLGFYSSERKGDMISRATGDVMDVEHSIMNSLELMFREPLAIILSLSVMFYMSVELTLFGLILIPVSGIVIGRISRSLKRTSAKGSAKMGELVSNLEETLGGLRIIKAFNAQKHVNGQFSNLNNEYRRLMIKAYRKRDLASPLNEFLGSMVLIALVWFGGRLIIEGTDSNLTGEEFIAYIIVFSQLLRPVQSIAGSMAHINKGMASLDRITNILEAEDTIPEKSEARPVGEFKDKIEYCNVIFSYGNEPVLKNINLTINKGKTVALVGESGGGKSTLADLLPRFYDTSGGGIYIDGQEIKDLKIQQLRGLFGIVAQESILFNDSVYNNIAFGMENITLTEVEAAARIANAHEFISQLPQGYHSNIGDRGGKLSGGQRQRISIARAVLRNPAILILDEATSALDTESEKLVQEALDHLMKGRTSIVIAHRLSTIQHADEIIVLQKGEIAERGTHRELWELNGIYRRLCNMQQVS